jgi:hypothetical protein
MFLMFTFAIIAVILAFFCNRDRQTVQSWLTDRPEAPPAQQADWLNRTLKSRNEVRYCLIVAGFFIVAGLFFAP